MRDYVPNSDLLAGWSVDVGQDVLETIRTYEAIRDLIDTVENLVDTNTVSLYDYTNDGAGRRIGRDDSGSAFGNPSPPEANVFGYNDRSELDNESLENRSVFAQQPPW